MTPARHLASQTAPTVLAIETSSAMGSIAVRRGDEPLFDASFRSDRSHNAQVFAPLSAALEAVGGAAVLDAVVAGTGPGSYAGARIGIAVAQALAMAARSTVTGLPSILAADLESGTYAFAGDARRGSAFLAEVDERTLTGGFRLVDQGSARQEVLEWLAAGRIVATFDADPIVPGMRCTVPRASILAQIVGRLLRTSADADRAGLASRSGRTETSDGHAHQAIPVIEPVYLREAYITQPVGAGKVVPRSDRPPV